MTNNSAFTADELPKTPFDAGIQLYNEQKPSDDRDLVAELRSWLIEAGCSEEAVANTYDLNRHVNSAIGRISIVQRTLLNQFLVLALLSSPKNTIQLRSDLLPSGRMQIWEDQIRDKVAPFIAENKLLG